MLRGFGGRLRQVLRLAMGDRIRAFASGLAVTALLQSSTATALMLAGFLDRGFVALPMALAAVLGANVGTTLIVQLLAFDISAIIPVLILAGVIMFRRAGRTKLRESCSRWKALHIKRDAVFSSGISGVSGVVRVVPGHGPASLPLSDATADVQRYLETLAADVRGVLRRGGDLDDAAQVAAQSERGRWQLFDEYNAHNIAEAVHEPEWENP